MLGAEEERHLLIMKRLSGFTLIEFLIAVTVMGILLGLGMPAFGTYLNNAKLRATAESFLAGIQTARGEAIRRNANVDFVLTAGDVSGANFAASGPSVNGQNWLIRTSDLSTYIEGKSAAEGGGIVSSGTSPVRVVGTVDTVTFGGFGTTTLGGAATFQFTNPTGGTCAASGGPMRCLNVVVSQGGQSRLCDPAVTSAQTAAGDTRGC